MTRDHCGLFVCRQVITAAVARQGGEVCARARSRIYAPYTLSQVPELWARAAYPSLKPLAAWVADYAARVDFMRGWLTHGPPAVFWLPGAAGAATAACRRCNLRLGLQLCSPWCRHVLRCAVLLPGFSPAHLNTCSICQLSDKQCRPPFPTQVSSSPKAL